MNNLFKLIKLSKKAGRKRIKERHIQWKEFYHEKSQPLKERFDSEIGPGSYYRWEGHDYTTDGDYFIVVGFIFLDVDGVPYIDVQYLNVDGSYEMQRVFADEVSEWSETEVAGMHVRLVLIWVVDWFRC